MNRQRPATTILALSSMLGLLAVFVLLEGATPGISLAAAPRGPAPVVAAISPTSAPNNLDTTVTITGANFVATPVVRLGNTALKSVGVISSTVLTATIPWGMNPGSYTVTVVNPDSQSGSLPNAFTVVQAIGVWTSAGPYGGIVSDMTVSPIVSTTAFAVVDGVGLFRTTDKGDHWSLALYDSGTRGVSYGTALSTTLYYWGNSGLWRSTDEGATFQQRVSGMVGAFASDPTCAQCFWIGHYFSLEYTSNGGTTWETRATGLPTDAWPAILVVDPLTPATVYVAMSNARVFKTTDRGLHWNSADKDIPYSALALPGKLAIDPFDPNILLKVYGSTISPGFRSTDGGANWSPVVVNSSPSAGLTDVHFSPVISGTVYASFAGNDKFTGISTDGGMTWSILGEGQGGQWFQSFALDPKTGLPVYGGALGSGAWRSGDGGVTWELATEGMTGLMVVDLAASSSRPERIYAAALGGGAFISDDAGGSWRELPLPYRHAATVAVDATDSERVIIGPGHSVFISEDAGSHFRTADFPGSMQVFMESMAIAPSSPTVVYTGGRDDAAYALNQSVGRAFRSLDFGDTWTPLTFTVPISAVSDVAIDPMNSQIVYVATGNRTLDMSPSSGKGIFRSMNGGETWDRITRGIGNVSAFGLAIDPTRPETLFATAWLSSTSKVTVFKSTDRGGNWTVADSSGEGLYQGIWVLSPVAVDPLFPNIIYAGAGDGLFASMNGGAAWTRAAGGLGQVGIISMVAVAGSERTITYVGTTGGLLSGSPDKARRPQASNGGFVPGGVYQKTVSHGSASVYMPLIMRR